VPACARHVPSHVPVLAQSTAKPRGSRPTALEFTAETDSALEGDGFEPSVPRQKDLCKHPDRRRSAGVIGMLVNPKFADAETQSREALAAALTLGLQLHIVTGGS
jgi:hypothetical protein